MTICFGKSCSFCLPCAFFVNVYVCVYFAFGFESGVWGLNVFVSDHCLSFFLLCYNEK